MTLPLVYVNARLLVTDHVPTPILDRLLREARHPEIQRPAGDLEPGESWLCPECGQWHVVDHVERSPCPLPHGATAAVFLWAQVAQGVHFAVQLRPDDLLSVRPPAV